MSIHDLIAHKGYADAAMLAAIRHHQAAAFDNDLRAMLHHILVANRFWVLSVLKEPFVGEVETRVSETLDSVASSFRITHERETAWLAGATAADLAATIEGARIPGGQCTVSDALLQVCLHSQGHRAQCAKRLRALGGSPPATDFILWVVDRPAPTWPV